MKTFEELLASYKAQPTEKLRDDIISRLLKIKEPKKLDELPISENDNWVTYGEHIRVKRLYDRTFIATEIYVHEGNKNMCLCYRYDLNAFSPHQIEAYLDNCREYAENSPDDDYFSAAAIAAAIDEKEAVSMALLGPGAIEQWVKFIEKEIK